MSSILDEIVANKKEEIAALKQLRPLSGFEQLVQPAQDDRFFHNLNARQARDNKFILEIKPASPSSGDMRVGEDFTPIVDIYSQYAAAISVLTDAKYFKGSLDLLSQIKAQTHCPLLCKDFMIDPYQIYQARLAGAEAVLLIVKILDRDTLKMLHDLASDLGMAAVVEVQNEAELDTALTVSPRILLVNNRNLTNFVVDFKATFDLAPLIPPGIRVISASGMEQPADIERLRPVCRNFLIGSALMKLPIRHLSHHLETMFYAGTH